MEGRMARIVKYASLSMPGLGSAALGVATHDWRPVLGFLGSLLFVFLFLNVWYSTSDRRVERLNLFRRNVPLPPLKPRPVRARRDPNPTVRFLRIVTDLRNEGRPDLADKVEFSILLERLKQVAESGEQVTSFLRDQAEAERAPGGNRPRSSPRSEQNTRDDSDSGDMGGWHR
jgi:hypothetical protein